MKELWYLLLDVVGSLDTGKRHTEKFGRVGSIFSCPGLLRIGKVDVEGTTLFFKHFY
jgi:hypothetical protein